MFERPIYFLIGSLDIKTILKQTGSWDTSEVATITFNPVV